MCLKWEIEDLSLYVIHSRKLNIKAIVTFYAVVDEPTEIRLPISVGDESVSVRKKKVCLMSLHVHKKDTMRVKEDIQLVSNRPNIRELLWHTIEARGIDLRPEDNVVKVKGELAIFVLYAGDDEGNPLQWMEYSLPFGGEVECPECRDELIPNIEVSMIHQGIEVKPDSDGEERIFQADVVLELDMKMYKEEEHDIVLDVYTPLKECVIHGKKEILDSLLVRNSSKCRLTDRVEVKETQGKVLQICHSMGRIKIDKSAIVEDGILVEGIVLLKVLYIIGNDDMPFYSMETMIPFTHVAEARGITKECTYFLQTDMEQLSTTMVDSNELEVKATVGINVLVLNSREEMIIEKVEEQPLDRNKIQNMPGITVYMTGEGDTMWDIAKRFYTTVDEICRINELEGDEVKPGQPLLLVKKVGG